MKRILYCCFVGAALWTGQTFGQDRPGRGTASSQPFITPAQFGAACDGVTDDTAAINAAFTALNTGAIGTLDFQGKSNLISSQPVLLTNAFQTLRNGTILYNSTSGAAIARGHNLNNGGDHFVVDHMSIYQVNTSGTAPGTNCVGIQLGETNNTAYGVNAEIEHCNITNFWRGIAVYGFAQTTIHDNHVYLCWSNAMWVANTPQTSDGLQIYNNDENNGDCPIFNILHSGMLGLAQTLVAIQIDEGLEQFTWHDENLGYCRQVFLCHPPTNHSGLAGAHIWSIQSQHTLNTGNGAATNYCAFEFWNSQMQLFNVYGSRGTNNFASSNLLAEFGIYADVGNNLNLSKDEFLDCGDPTFDVWGAATVDNQYLVPISANGSSELLHTNFGDTGTPYSWTTFGSSPIHFNGTNKIVISLPDSFGANSGGTEIDFDGGQGDGQPAMIIYNNGTGVDFEQGGGATFGNNQIIMGGYIQDRGAHNTIGLLGNNKGAWYLSSTTPTTPDVFETNGTLTFYNNTISGLPFRTSATNTIPNTGTAQLVTFSTPFPSGATVTVTLQPSLATNMWYTSVTSNGFTANVTAKPVSAVGFHYYATTNQ